MWIRNQDRTILVNADNFIISENDWTVASMTQNSKVIALGRYSSEKRALEVLDEIQKEIEQPLTEITSFDVKSQYQNVFQMPKE